MATSARGALAIAPFLLLMASSATATAQASDDDLARDHFRAATAYFEQARYEEASREFLEAYRLSPRPELLINAATARERALDFAGAAELLDRYLEDQPDADNRRTIETRRDRLRERADAAPAPAAVPTSDPPSSAARGADLSVALVASGLVGLGLGVVGVAVGAGLAAAREDNAAQWNGDACWDPETRTRATRCADVSDAVGRNETGAIVSFVVGGALLVAGAALVIVSASGSDGDRSASLACAPGLGSLACGGRF